MKKIYYTSDLGNTSVPCYYVHPIEPVSNADLVIAEATYANPKRQIKPKDRQCDIDKIKTVVEQTVEKGGKVETQRFNVFGGSTVTVKGTVSSEMAYTSGAMQSVVSINNANLIIEGGEIIAAQVEHTNGRHAMMNISAGSDVKMPESTTSFYEHAPENCDPVQMMTEGKLDRGAVILSVRRILKLMSNLE
jgi:hypothetical protein